MLRITTHDTASEFVMQLEGCLAGPWVRELDACWHDAVATLDGRPMRIDLTAVCHVNSVGRELLSMMYLAGARFVARGCVIPEIVREISESADSPQLSAQRS
jgi:anti-anti-sigma regulatory factor